MERTIALYMRIPPDKSQLLTLMRASNIPVRGEDGSKRAVLQNSAGSTEQRNRAHISTCGRVTSRVSNDSDRPKVSTRVLNPLETLTSCPASAQSQRINSGIETRNSFRLAYSDWSRKPELTLVEWPETFHRVAQTTPEPITSRREIRFANGQIMTIGGGTSNEALKRARKNQRRRA